MQTTKYIESPDYGDGTKIGIVDTEVPDNIGRLAIEYAERFALISGTPDGEDSSGRAKLRLGTPTEVVNRACELAIETWKQLRERGLVLTVPMPTPPKPWPERQAEQEAVREEVRKAREAAKAQPAAS